METECGAELNYSQYTNTTYQKLFTDRLRVFDYHTGLDMLRWGIFASADYTSVDERFTASLGVRTDGNNYSDRMKELWRQLSPRLSLSYRLAEGLFLSGHMGLYYQLPPIRHWASRRERRVCQPSSAVYFRIAGKCGTDVESE